jgi:hypothetical protein
LFGLGDLLLLVLSLSLLEERNGQDPYFSNQTGASERVRACCGKEHAYKFGCDGRDETAVPGTGSFTNRRLMRSAGHVQLCTQRAQLITRPGRAQAGDAWQVFWTGNTPPAVFRRGAEGTHASFRSLRVEVRAEFGLRKSDSRRIHGWSRSVSFYRWCYVFSSSCC